MESSDLSEREIRVMTRADLQRVLGWADEEGWAPGVQDAIPFLVADPEGFFVARKEDGGDILASVSAVRSGDTYGFIGLYICVPEFRGRGHGLALFRHALRHLEGRVMGLDAVVAQQANYAKHGFVMAHRTVRLGGEVVVDSTTSPTVTAAAAMGGSTHRYDDGLVVQTVSQDEDLQRLVDFDHQHVPAPRPEFVRAWLTTPGHVACAAIKDGAVEGYGVLRPASGGMRFGPLFAVSFQVAELLAKALLAASVSSPSASGEKLNVFIDVPEPNSEGIRLAETLGLREVFSAGRMYKGPAPSLPLGKIFGFTSMELG
ncbi:unnamed protein product [Scytosiphon promiscuus]